jgi:dienelactone hydrolase
MKTPTLLTALVLIVGSASFAQPLENTKPLDVTGDLAARMVDGVDRFALRETAESVAKRPQFWKRDFSSPPAYEASVAPNRARLAKMLGVVDERVKDTSPRYITGPGKSSLLGRGDGYEIHAVRWEALPGVFAEGLLLSPVNGEPVADVVALPDADQTPEMLAGLVDGIPIERQFAWTLGLAECRVLVPLLIDRSSSYSAIADGVKHLNLPHREFIYRPAFQVGRHVIGYELQKVFAAIDWFKSLPSSTPRKTAVVGFGEGGLLALYAGALDTRIDVVGVSGAFGPRENLWQEPIYRNVQGLLREFGDAELASLVAPRALVIDSASWPKVDGPPAPRQGEVAGAAPGELETPSQDAVDSEIKRLLTLVPKGWAPIEQDRGGTLFDALGRDERLLHLRPKVPASTYPPIRVNKPGDPQLRLKRQIDEMQAYTQMLVRKSDSMRKEFWKTVDATSVAKWEESTKPLRGTFYNDVIGRFDQKLLEPNPRTRKVYDEPKYIGYEVMLDVFPDVFAHGILLLPRDLKPGERRPVVVCQHGLDGRPQDVSDPKINSPYYHQFGCRLAEEGFITYAPQNVYIFGNRFRQIQRKLNPLGKQIYSIMIPQHEQTLNWLSSLPFVDPSRIAFYGLSYGGKTAMRIPAVETRYCLSICSGDFNEWIWKNTSLDYVGSYVGTGEYEIFEWNLGNTFNYAEMAGLICPRPFMVERGHHDGVGLDEWVSYEYAKVRRLYAELGIPQDTTIEYFLGPHEIHGVGTFQFLREKLKFNKRQ